MKSIIIRGLLFLLLPTVVFGQSTGTPGYANDPHWQFQSASSDDFATLNTSKWHIMDNFDHYGHHWVARAQNTYIENGAVVLEFKEESPAYYCPPFPTACCCVEQQNTGDPYQFSTGYVRSKFVIKPGSYLETKIKLPNFDGMNAGFWLINTATSQGNNIYSELDMLEGVVHNSEVIQSSNIHFDLPNGDPYDAYFAMGVDDQDWHIYGLEYTSEKLIWYIDNVKVREEVNPLIPTVFDIIISNGGDGVPQLTPSDQTKMYIDYVRHYNLPEDCENINVGVYSFSSHDNEVKNRITIGNSTSVNYINPNSIVSLRAKAFIQINGDFTVPLGSEFTMYPNDCNVAYP